MSIENESIGNLYVGQDEETLTLLQRHLICCLRLKNEILSKNIIVMRQCKLIDGNLFSPYSEDRLKWFPYKLVNTEKGVYSWSGDFFEHSNSKIMSDIIEDEYNIIPFVAVIPKGSYFYRGGGENISSLLVLLERFNSFQDYELVKEYIDNINRKNQTFCVQNYLQHKKF